MIKHILTLVWNKKRNNVLMLLEIFVAFLVLFAVFTFAIHYLRIYQSPLGFNTTESMLVNLTIEEEMDSIAQLQMREQLRREIEAFPEVEGAAFISGIAPFTGSMWSWSNDDNGFHVWSCIYPTDERYAEVAELNLIEGRWYDENDLNGKYPAAVVNKMFLDEYFPDKSIVDSVIHIGGERKIVGVVDYFKYRDEFEAELPLTFLQTELHESDLRSMHIRLRPGTPAEFEQELNTTIARITKRRDFVINALESERIRQSRSTWIPLIAGMSICGFLIINIALGLFGVLYYNISKRRAEIGLRRALGATQSEITSQFTFEVFLVALFAMLLAATLAVQFPLLQVIEIPAANFYWAILATFVLISIVVFACAFMPSRQAAGIHPAMALHEE